MFGVQVGTALCDTCVLQVVRTNSSIESELREDMYVDEEPIADVTKSSVIHPSVAAAHQHSPSPDVTHCGVPRSRCLV